MTQNGAEACLGSLFVVYFNGRVGLVFEFDIRWRLDFIVT